MNNKILFIVALCCASVFIPRGSEATTVEATTVEPPRKPADCVLQTSNPVYNFVPTDELHNNRTVFQSVNMAGKLTPLKIFMDRMDFVDRFDPSITNPDSAWFIAENVNGTGLIGEIAIVELNEECPSDGAPVVSSELSNSIHRVNKIVPYTMCTPYASADVVQHLGAHDHGNKSRDYTECARKAFADNPIAAAVSYQKETRVCTSYLWALVEKKASGLYAAANCLSHKSPLPGAAVGQHFTVDLAYNGMVAAVDECLLIFPHYNGVQVAKDGLTFKCVKGMESVDHVGEGNLSVFFMSYDTKYPSTTVPPRSNLRG